MNVFRGHEDEVHLLLPFGGHLVSVDRTSHVKVWDIQSAGDCLCLIKKCTLNTNLDF